VVITPFIPFLPFLSFPSALPYPPFCQFFILSLHFIFYSISLPYKYMYGLINLANRYGGVLWAPPPESAASWCFLALKYDIWQQEFWLFPENQLTKFSAA